MTRKASIDDLQVAVVGLGYVGLPLAACLGAKYRTIGYDHAEAKIANCRVYSDPAGEVSAADLKAASRLSFTSDPSALAESDVIIIAVPTPVDDAHIPDFTPLIEASATVGRHMKPGTIVVYESTVYPGATEEICIPVLEQHSRMRWACSTRLHIGEGAEDRGTDRKSVV
jgi:UDP-N-acetyl-D-galactosamine dehydrogenase